MDAKILDGFKQAVKEMQGISGTVYVIASHIDPDSIGSANGVVFILEMLGIGKIKILYAGRTTDEQNSAIIFRCGLMNRMESINKYFASFDTQNDRFVLVDSCSADDKRLGPAAGIFTPGIVIDHHGDQADRGSGAFVWIENIGACSTMVFELIKELDLLENPHFKNDSGVLPLLLTIGIHADTKGLVKCQKCDRLAFAEVSQFADESDLEYLINYQLAPEFMEALGRAIANKENRGTSVIACVGGLSAENKTIIARVADFFIRNKNYSLVLVWGIVDGKEIEISARALGWGTPLEEFLHRRFGDRSGAKSVSKLGLWEGGAQLSFDLGFFNQTDADHERLALAGKVLSNLFFGIDRH